MSIELMLADVEGRPVVSEGYPDDAATLTVKPVEPHDDGPEDFREDDKDPNELARQRWGIVIPEGPEGKRLAEIIAPLRAARKEQQGGNEPLVLTAPVGMSAEQAGEWWANVYNSEDIRPVNRPRYLLILGDANLVSWEAQQRFSSGAFVGRLAFPNDAGYEAYVHKILACERAERAGLKKVRATFHTVRDGTAATSTGHRGLMSPTLDAARQGVNDNEFPAADIIDLGEAGNLSPEDFLRAAQVREPTLLFSISHGLGTTPEMSDVDRRRIQGAMSFGQGKKILAEDVANRPFLPGGAWFFFACFSAGTPSTSAYRHWLQALKEGGMNVRQSDIDGVLAALAQQSSFTAALPQAVLANPDGPLAVMGHVDLAWTFSFQDGSKKFRPSRFHNIFRGIVDHSRIGCSFFDLQRVFNDANSDITDMLDTEERFRRRNETPPDAKTRPLKKAGLWMLRQDLTAYVLLGDPAARVTASASTEEVRKVPSIATSASTVVAEDGARTVAPTTGGESSTFAETRGTNSSLSSLDPARIEAAVFACVGDEALSALATHYGVSRADLDAWVKTYKDGGRAAVQAKSKA